MLNSVVAQLDTSSTFETKDYKIIFPNQFSKSTKVIASSLGELLMTIVSYEPSSSVNDSNYVYMIMESSYPDSTVHSNKTEMLNDFFNASINGAVKNVNGKLMEVTNAFTGKYPSRLITIDYQNGLAIINMKMILVNNNMIMIQTITSPKKFPNSKSLNFLNSFVLK